LTMLPVYLLGNMHCFGMCGPLVMMMGQHRFRYFYFLGRLFSFSMAGLIAGEMGAVLNLVLMQYQIQIFTTLFFGGMILLIAFYSLCGWQYPGFKWLSIKMQSTTKALSLLMLKDQPWPTFLFGFFTLLLPCGQTLFVFSACALAGDAWVGLVNGFAFALLTSPSLFLAMRLHQLFGKLKRHYNLIMGICAMIVGFLALLRGFAEMGWISHLILNQAYHIVIFKI
jgi:uncharacterized protein